jgi:hypothetical protein
LGRKSKKRKILLHGSCHERETAPMLKAYLGNEYGIASIFRPNAPLTNVTGDLEKLGNDLTK